MNFNDTNDRWLYITRCISEGEICVVSPISHWRPFLLLACYFHLLVCYFLPLICNYLPTGLQWQIPLGALFAIVDSPSCNPFSLPWDSIKYLFAKYWFLFCDRLRSKWYIADEPLKVDFIIFWATYFHVTATFNMSSFLASYLIFLVIIPTTQAIGNLWVEIRNNFLWCSWL